MAKKLTKSEPLPMRISSQIKEDDSRLAFEKVIKPWMISSWIQRDFGIDVIVEITKPLSNSNDQIVTGIRFSVQIKSSETVDFNKSEFSLSVAKDKINYWYNAIEPVLLVYIDLKSNSCFYRWIDEKLIQELFHKNKNWIAQDSVAIHFSKEKSISQKTLHEIEKYVVHWKRPSKTILTPGNYFKYSEDARKYISALSAKMKQYSIPFFPEKIKELEDNSNHSIYTIAIVGPTNAGKSTLINCLLHKEVSPVDMLPTTGIPIAIFPSNINKVIVTFKDDSELSGPVDVNFLKEYTSKNKNPNNQKKVKLVSVQIINTLLERGFAICDVPGLDDPDKDIRHITKTALYNVNAIIYLISAGTMASGDFSLNKQIIDDLNELGGKTDRLFLAFNKIDLLTQSQLDYVKEHVNETLEKHDILRYLPNPPFYISSGESFANRGGKDIKSDSVGNLENYIWQYLLSQNKTGLHKILGSFADSLDLIKSLKNVIKTRMISDEERLSLESEISVIRSEISELRRLVATNRKIIAASSQEFITNSFDNILMFLEKNLRDTSLNQQLPDDNQLRLWIEDNAFKILSDVYAKIEQDIYELQSSINQWISDKLKQIEIGTDNSEESFNLKMPEITKYTNQAHLYFHGSQRENLNFLQFIFQKIEDLINGMVTTIQNLLISDEQKRENKINSMLNSSRGFYKSITKECLSNLTVYLNKKCRFMEERSIDRTNVYLGALSTKKGKLNLPITQLEKEKFQQFLLNTSEIENGIISNLTHLKAYTDYLGPID